MRRPAKTAAKRAGGTSSTFPEIPRSLPRIPQRYSQRPEPEPTGTLLPEPNPLVFTAEAREAVARALMRARRQRLSEETLKTIIGDLTNEIYEAKFGIGAAAAPPEVIQLRKRLDRIAALAPQLRNNIEALGTVEGQVPLGDLVRYLDGQCPPPREFARHLAIYARAAKMIRPGRRTSGHPKAGTGATRHLADRIKVLLQKHGIPLSAEPGSIYEAVVRATWPCVEASPVPKSMKRFLLSILG
jgi:hypothetical protein